MEMPKRQRNAPNMMRLGSAAKRRCIGPCDGCYARLEGYRVYWGEATNSWWVSSHYLAKSSRLASLDPVNAVRGLQRLDITGERPAYRLLDEMVGARRRQANVLSRPFGSADDPG
jgi:hypothetical protein